jgi:erythronate-4-phosphate dehydrogenase
MVKPFTIVADENIPELEHFFSGLGEISRVNGRELKRSQLEDADILLVRSITPVNEALLSGTSVKFVATATIGIDHLDTDYLDEVGIGWCNAPGCNANSVVEYVFSVLCQFPDRLSTLMAGQSSVGIVGMGNVGGRLYQRLSTLGINCLGYDPLIDQSSFPILTDYASVLAAEVVCFHTPLSHSGPFPSFHMLATEQLRSLKTDTLLINAGRGAALDNSALLTLLSRNTSIQVALDVWEQEPAIDLALMAKVKLATAHIAGYSYDGKLAGTRMIYQACCDYFGLQAVMPASLDELCDLYLDSHTLPEGLVEAVLSSYDVAADDGTLRSALRDSKDHGRAFDLLRKQYRQRREFAHYRIANADRCDADLLQALRGLGFVIDD